MAKFGTYKNDPREIQARFDSVCGETGKPIRKGEWCVYYPTAKKVYHKSSKTADRFFLEREDMNVLGANY